MRLGLSKALIWTFPPSIESLSATALPFPCLIPLCAAFRGNFPDVHIPAQREDDAIATLCRSGRLAIPGALKEGQA